RTFLGVHLVASGLLVLVSFLEQEFAVGRERDLDSPFGDRPFRAAPDGLLAVPLADDRWRLLLGRLFAAGGGDGQYHAEHESCVHGSLQRYVTRRSLAS